jgi:hypothetical protein
MVLTSSFLLYRAAHPTSITPRQAVFQPVPKKFSVCYRNKIPLSGAVERSVAGAPGWLCSCCRRGVTVRPPEFSASCLVLMQMETDGRARDLASAR